MVLPVNAGTIYLKVKALQGMTMFTAIPTEGVQTKGNETAYNLAVYFLPNEMPAPHEFFTPGSLGKVDAWFKGPGEYHVEWDNIEPKDKSKQLDIQGLPVHGDCVSQ